LKIFKFRPTHRRWFFRRPAFRSRISPTNPRAIYFTDDVAVAYVSGGDGLEIASTDPRQGIILYQFKTDAQGKPLFTRRDVCLRCHQGPATLGVPGGSPQREGAIITDHRTKFEDRWGGWYVNARHGEQPDRANSVADNPADPTLLNNEGQQNLITLAGRFDPRRYLSPRSATSSR
jgi:hypothetical protein